MTGETRVMDIFRGTGPQLFAVISGTLAAISDGMQYGWTAPVIPLLLNNKGPFQTTQNECEWLETMLMLGAFCGLPITILCVDKLGRKRSLILSSAVTLIVWIAIAISPRIEYLYAARFFAGMAGDMAFVAAPMYIAEIADQKIRGFLSSIIYLMMLIGILIVYSVTPFVPYEATSVIGGGLVLAELIIFPFMPESPYYLLSLGKKDEARESLMKLRNNDRNIEKELEEISQAVERQKTERGRPQDLFLVASNRKAILIMAVLNGAQHLSSISVVLMNLHQILEAAKTMYITPSYAAIIFSAIMLIAATTASFSMDKFGRKVLLILSSVLTGICLLVIAVYFNFQLAGYNVAKISWIPVASVMCYAAVFKLGLGMVPIVITAEIFPAKMKAIGMTLADSMYVLFATISLQIYYTLTHNFGIHVPFYVFSISCFLTALFTYCVIPETKGKTLDEIQFILKGEKQTQNNSDQILV